MEVGKRAKASKKRQKLAHKQSEEVGEWQLGEGARQRPKMAATIVIEQSRRVEPFSSVRNKA